MNTRKMNVKAATTVSTTYFTYDHINKKIDGTEENFRMSGIPGSAQDLALMACRKEHPDYDYRIVKYKKVKNSYKGLNRPLMHDYIDCFGIKEQMDEFEKLKNESTSFGSLKSWFLNEFPAFSNVEKATKEIQKFRRGAFMERHAVVAVVPKSNRPALGTN